MPDLSIAYTPQGGKSREEITLRRLGIAHRSRWSHRGQPCWTSPRSHVNHKSLKQHPQHPLWLRMFEGRVPARRAPTRARTAFFGAGMTNNRNINGATSDLIDAFTETVGRFSARPAIVHHGHVLSYRQLGMLAGALAERLGAAPGVVAVPAVHTPETVVGLLGVLAAGGAYCPVDPAIPPQRRQAMLTAVGCRTGLATATGPDDRYGPDGPLLAGPLLDGWGLEPGLDGPALGLVGLPRLAGPDTADPVAEPPAGEPRRIDPEQPAYLLFTSGSTGQPKPVVTPRRAISVTVASLRELFGLTPDDRVLQFASLNWDTCFEEILPTLTAGATLVLDAEAHSGSFPRFLRMVERERITVLDLPTAFWNELVLHLTEERRTLPGSVRLVVIGGEAANPARLADWAALDTGRIRLLNTYGSTETTLITHAVDLHGPRAAERARPWAAGDRVPIGRALPHVLERIGEQDELLVGGPAVALGYHGLPEATGARFAVVDEVRWFRTGDRVSRAPDGVLTHRGRLDGELKVRGIRVDPAEVEAEIAGHPGVTAVAVTGATLAGRSVLVAYVVPRPGATAGTLDADVRAYLRGRVPGHLVPSRITVVPELVLTASGKVDRAGSHGRHAPHGPGSGRTPGAAPVPSVPAVPSVPSQH
ncbi:amino acid adenylation domain-containing protein [Kitasatospora sp. NPDC050467]|uniref:amino acid adenylation domain-containing protein n=1 Tax=Kitasatospora sp. NPDC050467 TaxID=3364053 RepID=UPI0037A3B2F2